jgi:hypothetical protein
MKKLLLTSLLISIGTVAFASEAYIDQAGGTVTVDVTQTGDNNLLGFSSAPSRIYGNSIDIDLVQTGANNIADLQLIMGADSTVLDYNVTGDINLLDVWITGGIGNRLNSMITGDNNRLSFCAENDAVGTITALSTPMCSLGVAVNDTTNIVNVDGSDNQVNLSLASADAVNTIEINNSSNWNVVNLTQTDAGAYTNPHIVTLTIDGDTNVVNILQN